MKLNFKTYGRGPALIVLHGLFGSLDNWVSHARVLEQTYSVYLVDLRNHGRSPHSPEHTYRLMADDLLELMDDEGILNAFLLGHSMGGKVAMEFAGHYPDRVEKLVVADMGIKAYPPHHTLILDTLRQMPLATLQNRKEAETYLRTHLQDETTTQFLLKGLGRDEQNRFEWKFNFQALDDNYQQILAAVHPYPFDKPTLFVYGGKSHYVLPADIDDLMFHFPQAVFEEMPDTGHWVHAENPALFLEIVGRFLAG